jgi:hypothetical protein
MPSRSDGFAIMDVSTSICDDPKFRRLLRENPELVAPAFTAYVSVMAESWKIGKRMPVEDAWPGFLPFDQTVCDALRRVALVDARGLVSSKAWRGWFEPARERRSKSRDRWARYNAKRDADTTFPPRGSDADTATSVPPVPSGPSGPTGSSVPPVDAGARGKMNGQMTDDERRLEADLLHAEWKAGRLDDMEYARRRKALGAA